MYVWHILIYPSVLLVLISLWLFQYPIQVYYFVQIVMEQQKYSFRQLVIFTVSFLTE